MVVFFLQFISANHLRKHLGELPPACSSDAEDRDENFMLHHDLKIIATSMGLVQYACLLVGCFTLNYVNSENSDGIKIKLRALLVALLGVSMSACAFASQPVELELDDDDVAQKLNNVSFARSAMSDSTAVNNENMDIPETGTGNHEVLATSPVPEGAENIQKDLSEVWEDVFGSTDDKVTDIQLSQLCPVQNNVSTNATDASSSILVHVAENSLTDNQQFSHMLDNNNDLTPFALEAPSSFENSPAISFGDLPSIPTHYINSTPMPSPLNTHKNCHDAFCPTHDDDHWTMSPSTSNAHSTTNYYSDDELSAPPKKRSKKRLRRTSEWSDVKRKYLKNIGQKYVTKKGKQSWWRRGARWLAAPALLVAALETASDASDAMLAAVLRGSAEPARVAAQTAAAALLITVEILVWYFIAKFFEYNPPPPPEERGKDNLMRAMPQ
ncbi:unnamed protein product [Spodoptera exigua]|nr:unnamed protein product [Spodoptera exigua]